MPIIDASRKLPFSTSCKDLLFESTKLGFYELRIKPQEKEIIIFTIKGSL